MFFFKYKIDFQQESLAPIKSRAKLGTKATVKNYTNSYFIILIVGDFHIQY